MSHGLLAESVEQGDGKLGKQMTFPGCPPDWGQNNWRRRLAMRQARKERQKRWKFQGRDTIHVKRKLRVTPRLTIRHAQISQAARAIKCRLRDCRICAPGSRQVPRVALAHHRQGQPFPFFACQMAGIDDTRLGKKSTNKSAPLPAGLRMGACCHVHVDQGSRCNPLGRRP
jgi:hypothetical protein